MIVPSSRLLFWVGAVVLPFALLGAVESAAVPVALGGIGALLLVAIGDAIVSGKGGANLEVELPPIVRISKDRATKIEVRIRNRPLRRRTVRLALGLPREIVSSTEIMDIV